MTRSPFSQLGRVTNGSRLVMLAAALVALLLAGGAFGHAELRSSDPEDGAYVTSLESITAEFTEPVEVPFSTFRFVALDIELGEDPEDISDRERQRINGMAAPLASELVRERDGENLATLLTTDNRSATVTFEVDPELSPGVYLFAWRVLSIDTHITEGFVTFILGE